MTHERHSQSDDWFTPRYIFDALGERFDLDVAAPNNGPKHVPANGWLSSNGLQADWHGFVFMNPPFGHQRQKREWLTKFFEHGNGIALVPDRTSAPWWQEFAPKADAVLFMSPKVKFERPDGSIGEQPGTGTCLFAAGHRAVQALWRSNLGVVMIDL
jgi:hypothetical protein